MRTKRFRSCVGALVWACLLLCASEGRAQLRLDVELDTTPLSGLTEPFSLAFQLIDGSGTGNTNNTVILHNFQFGVGGSTAGNPSLFGGATGDLSSSVTLLDSFFISEFTEGFTPGSALRFRVDLTTNPEVGAPNDQFTFSLLEGLTALPTTGPGNALLTVDLGSATVQTFGADPALSNIALGAPVVQVIPEPSTAALLSAGLVGLVALRRRRPC